MIIIKYFKFISTYNYTDLYLHEKCWNNFNLINLKDILKSVYLVKSLL